MSDDYCEPPTDRLCNCRQCRAEWEQREREMTGRRPALICITVPRRLARFLIAAGAQPGRQR